MKILLTLCIIVSAVLILVNIFSIDYDELANWEKNRTSILNLAVSILVLIAFVVAKEQLRIKN